MRKEGTINDWAELQTYGEGVNTARVRKEPLSMAKGRWTIRKAANTTSGRREPTLEGIEQMLWKKSGLVHGHGYRTHGTAQAKGRRKM